MSFRFSLAMSEPPEYRAILDALADEELTCEESEPLHGPWPEGFMHFYRPGVSTRSVEISRDEDQMHVRILAFSSADDFRLAFRFLETIAEVLDSPILPEDGDLFDRTELYERYDADWVATRNLMSWATVKNVIRHEEETITIPGPLRDVFVGPDLVERLEEEGSAEKIVERLMLTIRTIQYLDPDQYFPAESMELAETGRLEPPTFAVWAPDCGYLFPEVDYLALYRGDDEPVFLPLENLADVLEDGWEYLDECQISVQPISEHVWYDLVARAEECAVDPWPQQRRAA